MSNKRPPIYSSHNITVTRDILPIFLWPAVTLGIMMYLTRNLHEGDIWFIYLAEAMIAGLPALGFAWQALILKIKKDRVKTEGKHAVFTVEDSKIGLLDYVSHRKEEAGYSTRFARELVGTLRFDNGEKKKITVNGAEYIFHFREEEMECFVTDDERITFV